MTKRPINWQTARAFCRCIAGQVDPPMTFQTVDDKGKLPHLRGIRHGRLSDKALRDWLEAKNAAGAAVYVTINETDGEGRRYENILAARASFIDLDGRPLPSECPIVPHVLVSSSPGKYHAYWLLQSTTDLALWTDTQARLAAFFKSDPKVIDAPRVLRLPGFWHLKGKPSLVKIINAVDADASFADRLELADLIAAHECEYQAPAQRAKRSEPDAVPDGGFDKPADVERARVYIAALDPSDYDAFQDGDLYAAACELKDYGISRELSLDLLHKLNKRAAQPWTDEKLAEKVTNSRRYGQNTAGAKSAPGPRDEFEIEAEPDEGETITDDEWPPDQVEEQSDGTWLVKWDSTPLKVLKNWQFIVESFQFVHDDGVQFLDANQFEMKFGKLSPTASILTKIKRGKFPMKRFTAQVYVPNKPPVFRYQGPPTMPYEGKTVFNLWRPGPMKAKAGEHQWFLDHVAKLFPKDEISQALLFDYMAQLVQHPDVKIHFALLLQSVEGAGKGALARVLRRIIGDRNTVEPSNDEVTDKYSGWQERAQIAIINELYAADRADVFNRLKQPLTEDKLRIHKKYGHQFDIPNFLNLFAMTNHKDAVALTKTDRRWLVLFSTLTPGTNDAPYYEQLFKNIADDEKVAAVMHYLMTRKITLNPKAHAPGTEAKIEMQERVRSDSIVELQRLLVEGVDPFDFPVVRFEDVIDYLKGLNRHDARAGLNVNRFFDHIGARRLRRYTKGGPDLPAVQLWAVKDQDKWDAMSPKAVACAYRDHIKAKLDALANGDPPEA